MLHEKLTNALTEANRQAMEGELNAQSWLSFMSNMNALANQVRQLEQTMIPPPITAPNVVPFRPRVVAVSQPTGGDAA